MNDSQNNQVADPDREQKAARAAQIRARSARWDLDIALFLFSVLIIVIILLFKHITIEIVGPVAALGLASVWLFGWMRGKGLYKRFYEEELARLGQPEHLTIEFSDDPDAEEIIRNSEDSIEEIVVREIRKHWQRD
jgi:hypothetical protein